MSTIALGSVSARFKSLFSGRKILDGLVAFFWGDKVSVTFFHRNLFFFVALIGFLLVLMSLKYNFKLQKDEIDDLNALLQTRKSESVRLRAEFRSGTRESIMQERIDALHLNLHVQEQPPFVLVNTQKATQEPKN